MPDTQATMLAVQHDWCTNLIRRREGSYESTRSRLDVEGRR